MDVERIVVIFAVEYTQRMKTPLSIACMLARYMKEQNQLEKEGVVDYILFNMNNWRSFLLDNRRTILYSIRVTMEEKVEPIKNVQLDAQKAFGMISPEKSLFIQFLGMVEEMAKTLEVLMISVNLLNLQ